MATPPSTIVRRRRLVGVAAAAVLAALVITGPPPATSDVHAETGPADAPPPVALKGYLRDERGRFSSVFPPGATDSKLGDINNRGQIVGA